MKRFLMAFLDVVAPPVFGYIVGVFWSMFFSEWLAVVFGVVGFVTYRIIQVYKDDERHNP